MSDRWIYGVCACAFAGAWLAWPGSWPASLPALWPLGLALLGLALLWRRPWLVCLAMLLASSLLAARAEASYEPIVQGHNYTGWAVLQTDPKPASGGGWHVELSLPGHSEAAGRYDTWAYGRQAAQLQDRLAGERVEITATTRPLRQPGAWHQQRHIVGSLSLHSIHGHSSGAWHYQIANAFRRTLEAGIGSLSAEQQSLFTGLVFGDDREQSALLNDNFLAGGLTHLLAVSGQNVVFVLLLAQPLLRRLGLPGRWAASLVVLALFATMTRFEPSVTRASVMAGVAATSTLLGRQESGKRHLALAVCVLVLLDPQIVHLLGFQLSVLASAGILFWAGPLAERLAGPRPLALALAVTIAAQLWVAPLLVLVFGGVPVGSLWANLLAVPVAGPLMMWGMTAGGLAGLLVNTGASWGPALAAVIHWPTQLGINWLSWVAGAASRYWLGELRLWHVVVVGVCTGAVLLARRRSRVAVGFGSLAVVVLALPSLALVSPGTGQLAIGPDSTLWRGSQANVLELGSQTSDRQLLAGLRQAGIKQLHLLVARGSAQKVKAQLLSLRVRYGDFEAWLANGQIAGSARRLTPGTAVLGDIAVHITPQLAVQVDWHHGYSRT